MLKLRIVFVSFHRPLRIGNSRLVAAPSMFEIVVLSSTTSVSLVIVKIAARTANPSIWVVCVITLTAKLPIRIEDISGLSTEASVELWTPRCKLATVWMSTTRSEIVFNFEISGSEVVFDKPTTSGEIFFDFWTTSNEIVFNLRTRNRSGKAKSNNCRQQNCSLEEHCRQVVRKLCLEEWVWVTGDYFASMSFALKN